MRDLTDLIPSDAPPLMNAAGTVKSVEQLRRLLTTALGVIVAGSYTVQERPGNPGEVYFSTPLATLNSLGLPGPALVDWARAVTQMKLLTEDAGKRLWVSVAGFNPQEYAQLTQTALESGADAVELNLACPNIWDEGEQKPIVSFSASETERVLDAIASVVSIDSGTLGVKLSPLLDTVVLREIDRVIAESGLISFVTAINTVPNCFAMNRSGPAITFGKHLAGMSGPAVKWLGQGQIILHREHLAETVLIGVGGIDVGLDLGEYLSSDVGADACQIGTALWERGPRAVEEILAGFVNYSEV